MAARVYGDTSMKTIFTNKKAPIIVDDDKFEYLNQFKWHVNGAGYTEARINKKMVFMHRLLLGLVDGDKKECDHINGIRTDNRIENLRVCTRNQNGLNTNVRKDNKLGAKCVRKTKYGTYRVGVRANGKEIHVGVYKTIEEAITAREKFAKEHHGEFFK